MKMILMAILLVAGVQAHAQSGPQVSDTLVKKAIACARERHNLGSIALDARVDDATTIQIYVNHPDHIATVAWIKIFENEVYEQDLVSLDLLYCSSNNH